MGETFAQKLAGILEENKIISKEESTVMQKIFKDSSKENFDEFLLEEGLVEEEDLLKSLSQYYKVPAFDVVGHFFRRELLRKFPKDVMLSNAFIPLEVDKNMLIVVASEPDDPGLLARIGECVSYDVRFRVGLRRDIVDTIREFYYKSVAEVDGDSDSGVIRQTKKDARQETLQEEDVFIVEEESD